MGVILNRLQLGSLCFSSGWVQYGSLYGIALHVGNSNKEDNSSDFLSTPAPTVSIQSSISLESGRFESKSQSGSRSLQPE